MKLFAVIFSWVCMIAACLLLSRSGIGYSLPVALMAVLLHSLPPKVKLRRFASFDPFIVILTSWGMFVTASREHWADSTILVARIVAVALLVVAAGWCLFRDWHRFRVSGDTPNAA